MLAESGARAVSVAMVTSLWQTLVVTIAQKLITAIVPIRDARSRYMIHYWSLVLLGAAFIVTLCQQRWILETNAGLSSDFGRSYSDGTAHSYLVRNYTSGSLISAVDFWRVIDAAAPYLALLYLSGLLLMNCLLVRNLLGIRQMMKLPITSKDACWDKLISKWCAKMGLAATVTVRISDVVKVPSVIGVIKPIILLPITTCCNLSDEEIEMVLLHELAHLKRNDYVDNIFQVAIETLLFFNPLIWAMSSVVRKERELCCDDMVVAIASKPQTYARALAMLETSRSPAPLAMGASSDNKYELLNRIKRIMNMKTNNRSYGFALPTLILLGVVFCIAILTMPTSFAQKRKTESVSGTRTVVVRRISIDSNGHKTVADTTFSGNALPADFEKETEKEDGSETEGKRVRRKTVVSLDSTGLKREITTITINGSREMEALSIKGDDFKQINADLALMGKDLATMGAELAAVGGDLAKMDEEFRKIELTEVDTRAIKQLKDEALILRDSAAKMKTLSLRNGGNQQVEIQMRHRNPRKAVQVNVRFQPDMDFTSMIADMRNDGLLSKRGNFKISKERGELFINGTLQPRSVLRKYASYLHHEKVLIRGKKDHIRVNVEN